jgi:hypothetical protein
MDHEVKGGGIRLPSTKSKTYQMYLTIDGQKRFRSTETSDCDDAVDKLKEWEAQAKIGHRETSGLRYEETRDDYLASGKNIKHPQKGWRSIGSSGRSRYLLQKHSRVRHRRAVDRVP